MSWEVRVGDALERLREMPDESVDAVVTDPPYGIGFMGHEWDQPGEHGPVRSNGTPAPFARGRRSGGDHAAGSGADGRVQARAGVPPGQRKASNPKPSGFEVYSSEKRKKLGLRAESRERPGAMEAGRYDLSLSANRRFQEWCEAWAVELLRVLKPGGHCLVFGGTRTYHRLTSGLEDAGFEIRDCLMWLYGSGFPKSLDVAKAIDRAAGVEREDKFEGSFTRQAGPSGNKRCEECGKWLVSGDPCQCPRPQDEPVSEAAVRWEGWGTALKPSWEPIVVARKPFAGTVAGNVLEHGTAALNIDGCRIATTDTLGGGAELDTQSDKPDGWDRPWRNDPAAQAAHAARIRENVAHAESLGRWPSNVVLAHDEDCVLVGRESVRADGHFPAARGASGYGSAIPDSSDGGLKGQEDLEERHFDGEIVERWACVRGCPVRMLDDQAGELASGANPTRRGSDKVRTAYGDFEGQRECTPARGAERGGASRFYYCAKASRAEREAGLDGFERREILWSNGTENPGSFQSEGTERSARNHHPTVKPIDLMRWLVRLVTPPGGTVLDCFVGSGTTGCAAVLEGFGFVGIERQEDYAAVARARVGFWEKHPTGLPVEAALKAEARRRRVRESGQLGLGVEP